MPEFAPTIAVSSLNAQKGFRLDGEAALDQVARAVAGGDVNGDARAAGAPYLFGPLFAGARPNPLDQGAARGERQGAGLGP